MSDLWGSVKQGLSSVVPLIANAIIPGSGGVTSSLVASILKVDNTPEAITTAIANLTPEQTAALKQAEMTHQENLLKIGADNDSMFLLDRQDARKTEVERMKVTGSKDINLYVLAWTFIMGFFILMAFLMFYKVPDANVGPVNQLFGALAGGVGLVLGYFFGSSKGSADKTVLLAQQGQK